MTGTYLTSGWSTWVCLFFIMTTWLCLLFFRTCMLITLFLVNVQMALYISDDSPETDGVHALSLFTTSMIVSICLQNQSNSWLSKILDIFSLFHVTLIVLFIVRRPSYSWPSWSTWSSWQDWTSRDMTSRLRITNRVWNSLTGLTKCHWFCFRLRWHCSWSSTLCITAFTLDLWIF